MSETCKACAPRAKWMRPRSLAFSNQFSQTWLMSRAMVPYTSSPWIGATWVRCWKLGVTPLAHLKTYASGQKLPFSDALLLSAMHCIACRRCFAIRNTFIACRAVNGGMGSLYRSQHELFFVFKSGTATHINNVDPLPRQAFGTNAERGGRYGPFLFYFVACSNRQLVANRAHFC